MLNYLRHLTYAIPIAIIGMVGCTETHAPKIAELSLPATTAQTLLEPWNTDQAPGVAVAISIDGETVFKSGFGIANLEYDIPISPETIFEAASVSKQFTAFSVMLLESEGRLSLDDDIRIHLPELQDRRRLVTVRHLLDHMSGYRDVGVLAGMAGWMEDDIQTNEQFMRLIKNQTGENFAPGDHVEYSNTGYILLSQIVERVSGQTFHDFTKQSIFEPLEMDHTHFHDDRARLVPNHAESYQVGADGFRKFPLVSENVGDAGLKTTALDLLKWAENYTVQTVGDEQTFTLMAERHVAADGRPSTFGRGQELRPYKGLQTWSHGGRNAGFRSFLLRIPEQRFAISILSNRTDFDTAKIAFQLADVYLKNDASFKEEAEATWELSTALELDKLSGTYELYPGLLFEISTDGDGLQFGPLGAGARTSLPQIGALTFQLSAEAGLSLIFETDATGRATAFNYTIGLHGALPAPRISLLPFDTETINLEEYSGTYYSPELATEYEITHTDDTLSVSHLRVGSANMTAYQEDTFSAPDGFSQKFSFVRDENNIVTGAMISGAVAKDVLFYRIKREH